MTTNTESLFAIITARPESYTDMETDGENALRLAAQSGNWQDVADVARWLSDLREAAAMWWNRKSFERASSCGRNYLAPPLTGSTHLPIHVDAEGHAWFDAVSISR